MFTVQIDTTSEDQMCSNFFQTKVKDCLNQRRFFFFFFKQKNQQTLPVKFEKLFIFVFYLVILWRLSLNVCINLIPEGLLNAIVWVWHNRFSCQLQIYFERSIISIDWPLFSVLNACNVSFIHTGRPESAFMQKIHICVTEATEAELTTLQEIPNGFQVK